MFSRKNERKSIMDIGLFPLAGQYLNEAGQYIANALWKLSVLLFGPKDQGSMDGNDKLYLRVTVASVIVSLFLGGISFAGSYTAGKAYAESHGVAQGVAAWIPISVDGFILLLVLIRFGGSLVGTDEKWVQFLMIAFALISVLFNVSHISSGIDATWMQWLLGCIFPGIVFAASEATAIQITNYIRRKTKLRSNLMLEEEYLTLKGRNDNLQNEIDIEMAGIKRERLKPILDQIEVAKDELDRANSQSGKGVYTEDDIQTAYLMGGDKNITGKAIAESIGKSLSAGGHLKRKIKEVINGAT